MKIKNQDIEFDNKHLNLQFLISFQMMVKI